MVKSKTSFYAGEHCYRTKSKVMSFEEVLDCLTRDSKQLEEKYKNSFFWAEIINFEEKKIFRVKKVGPGFQQKLYRNLIYSPAIGWI